MNHPIDNQYRYGLVYDLNGQIVGFNLSPDLFIGLTDEEIEKAMEGDAKQKLEQKKQEDDEEIHVGNEIILNEYSPFDANTKAIVVMKVCTDRFAYRVMIGNGYMEWVDQDAIDCKTGRHFPEISEVLKKMKEGE